MAAVWGPQFSIGQEWDGGILTDLYAGSIDDLRIYDNALTLAEVNVLAAGQAVPEPSTYAMLVLGLIGLGVYQRKRKK